MALPFLRQTLTPTQDEPLSLVEFRAGRMQFVSGRVQPDARKGTVRIIRTDDGLLHFQWLDRTTGAVEEDQIVFPEEAVFEKVTQSAGRVYLLRFKNDDRKFFFWMQEPKQEQDASLCEAVNREMMEWLDEGHGDPDDPDFDEEMAESSLRDGGPTSQPQTAEIPASGANQEAVRTGAGIQPTTPVQLSDLQNILSGLGQLVVPTGYMGGSNTVDVGPSLSQVLKPEFVLPLLQNLGVQERLAPYLPEGLRTPEAMRDLIQSPQFNQQLEVFSHLLQSGQIDWSQFGIDPSKYGLGVTAFLSAIEDQVQTEMPVEDVSVPLETNASVPLETSGKLVTKQSDKGETDVDGKEAEKGKGGDGTASNTETKAEATVDSEKKVVSENKLDSEKS